MRLILLHLQRNNINHQIIKSPLLSFFFHTHTHREKKAKTVKGSDKSVFADKVCDRIKELMEKPENSSVLGIPAFFDNFTETVKLEAQATRLQAGKSSSSSASIDSQQGKRADANLADKVCLELLDRLLALTNANIQRSTTTAIDSTVLRAAGRLVPNLAKIYGMHRLAAEETKMLEELTAKALPALATHTEAAEELFTAVLQVDNLVVEKHIPQILSKVAASKHSGRGVFLLGFIDTYTKLRQVDTTFTDTTLEAFALMIAEGCAAGSVFTPEASIRLGETVFLRLIPAQVSTVMEKLLAFYNAHFAAVPSANADTVATVFHEFCVMWIAVASGASTVSAPLLGAAIGKTLKALVEGFKGINVEEEEDNDNNNFGWASETLFALCNIMNACQAPKGAGLDAGEFYSVVVKKFFSMCKKACTENSATATPLEKAKAEYAKMELVLAFLRFFDGDDNCERVRQKLLAKVVRHTPDPAKLVPSQPSSSSSSSGAAAPALDPALCDVYFAHWQLTLQNIRTLCTYEKENRVMSLIESLFKSAATSATTDTFTGRLAELSAATLCDASLYQIPFFKHKGVESALNSIFAINTVSTEVDRLGLGSLETLNWEALSAAVGDFRARSEAVMSAEECMCLRHLAALLGIYPAAFYRGVEEKALCYLVLVLAVILRTVPDEWTRARLVDSVVGVTEKIILILINHSNRSNDGDSGYELITKMIPKKFFSLLLREDRMKIFAVYIQSIIDSGSVSDIPAFLEDLCEKGSAERTAEHIAALAVYCADAINTRLLAAQSSDDKTVTAAPDDVTKYFGFVRYCINKLLVFSNDDTVFASKVFSLNTRLLKFNEIYCMYYREGGGTEEKEAAFTELFKKQGSLFLRKLTALVRSNSGASQGRLTGSIVEYVEALVHSICIRKKGVPTPLYARLVALIHFVASHLVVGKSGTEAELSTMKFTYGRLLGKGDPEQRSMCLECIQDELSSQTPERSKTAIAFLEVYVSRTHFLYNETLAGLLFIVSTYASSTSADDLPYAIKAFSNLCWVLSEKLYTYKDGKPKKHLTKEQESEQQQQQKRKPKKDEGGQKGNAVGGLIATYALKCLDEITRRSDITSDIFGELTRFLHFLIPFVHKMTPLLFSIIQNMIVRTFDFYNRGGRNAAALKDAAICGGFVSRILGEISRHGNRYVHYNNNKQKTTF